MDINIIPIPAEEPHKVTLFFFVQATLLSRDRN